MSLRKCNLQLFAEGDADPAASQETDLASLFNLMPTSGASAPAAAPATPPPSDTAPPSETVPPAQTTPPEGTPPPEDPVKTPDQVFNGDKQNQAFAAMRVQNTQYSKVLGKMAEVLGIKDIQGKPEALLDALNERLMLFESQQTNVPVELLKRIEQTEKLAAQNEARSREEQANIGFQRVKDTFKLDDKALIEFARRLSQEGKDPYQNPMDLIQEYRNLNYDAILKKAQEDAVREALAKQTKSAAHSTTPSSAQGKPSSPAAPVNDMASLDALLQGFNGVK